MDRRRPRVGEEGAPLTTPPAKVHNPETDAMNAHTATMAAHLAKVSNEQPAEPAEAYANGGSTAVLNSAPISHVNSHRLQSPLQIIDQVEQMQKDEMDQLLQRLQMENLQLRKELERKKHASTSDINYHSQRRSESRTATLPLRNTNGRSVPSLKSTQSQSDVMDEAKALRVHKQRLEHRSRILEQQNEQLEIQLQRLKKIINQQKESSSVAPSQRATSTLGVADSLWTPEPQTEARDVGDGESQMRGSQMQSLMTACDDLGRAMESLVVSVVYDSEDEEQ
ncbi:unnamed protein product [Caenorhabditis auriculariae]|uniref:Uncharacterized protein n=1 Tax=Caenorhabditis auriculariae TaxID=2777116 RepID=A0A8S1GPW0_9PELO|nr:unnamed protein product [Caenorhabditis auriculariae]